VARRCPPATKTEGEERNVESFAIEVGAHLSEMMSERSRGLRAQEKHAVLALRGEHVAAAVECRDSSVVPLRA
jgi:hypothetical protein